MDKYLNGTNGQVWINGELAGNLTSIELKVTGKFEDIDVCGDFATHSLYMGWSGEGSLKFKKVTNRGSNLLATAYQTGIMPDVKIISALTDKSTGKTERVSVEEVTITEFMLTNFEAKSPVDEELPLKFAKYTTIENL